MDTASLAQRQQEYFLTGVTLLPESRKEALHKLLQALEEKEEMLLEAVRQDLDKSHGETYLTELGPVKAEIRTMLRNVDHWAKPKKVRTPLAYLPSRSRIYRQPYGVILIMGSWNYPLQLNLMPLVDAMAAGNCAVVKPSAYAPNTSAALKELLSSLFPEEYVCVVEGGREVNTELLAQKYDRIFFTGSKELGKTVMHAAAENLTPVTLELGGKCPAIVDATADLEAAAKRIIFGKLLNAGQTCVAPDYVFVHDSVEQDLVSHMQSAIQKYLGGKEALEAPEYPSIVNEKHFDRLIALMKGQRALCGGVWDRERRKIAPTLLTDVKWDSAVMQEEIFGPILPIIPYRNIGKEVIRPLKQMEKPLALYFFSRNEDVISRVMNEISFGGGCLNDTIMHCANNSLPFGGVGESGMGAYHGKAGFDLFTHDKGVMIAPVRRENNFRYPPFDSKMSVIKKFL